MTTTRASDAGPSRRGAAPEAATEQGRARLLRLLCDPAKPPQEILADSGLAPSDLLRTLRGPRMRMLIRALAQVAEAQRAARDAVEPFAVQQLRRIARGRGESARKACLDLHRLGIPAGEPGAAEPLDTRLDDLLAQVATLEDDPAAAGGDSRPSAACAEVRP